MVVPESPRWLLFFADRQDEAYSLVKDFSLSPESARIEWEELYSHVMEGKRNRAAAQEGMARHWTKTMGLKGIGECLEKETRGRTCFGAVSLLSCVVVDNL